MLGMFLKTAWEPLSVSCYFIKWPQVYAIADQRAVPKELHSDQILIGILSEMHCPNVNCDRLQTCNRYLHGKENEQIIDFFLYMCS